MTRKASTIATGIDNEHDPAYWQNTGEHTPSLCFKHEGWYRNGHGSGDGKTWTMAAFDPAWDFGDHWELLVVKAGTERIVTVHPVVGQAYPAPDGKDISHVIVCKGQGEVPVETTIPVDTTHPEQPTTTQAQATTTSPPATTVLVPPSTIATATTPAPAVDIGITVCTDQPALCLATATTAQVTGTAQLPETATSSTVPLGIIAAVLLALGTTLVLVRRPRRVTS